MALAWPRAQNPRERSSMQGTMQALGCEATAAVRGDEREPTTHHTTISTEQTSYSNAAVDYQPIGMPHSHESGHQSTFEHPDLREEAQTRDCLENLVVAQRNQEAGSRNQLLRANLGCGAYLVLCRRCCTQAGTTPLPAAQPRACSHLERQPAALAESTAAETASP